MVVSCWQCVEISVFNNLPFQGYKRREEFQTHSVPNKKVPPYINHDPRFYSHQVSQNDPRLVPQSDPRLVLQSDPRLALQNDPRQVSRHVSRLNSVIQDPRSLDPRTLDPRTLRGDATMPMSNFSSGSSSGPYIPPMHPQAVNSQYQNHGQFPHGSRQQPQFAMPQSNNAKVYKSQKPNFKTTGKDENFANRNYHSHIY